MGRFVWSGIVSPQPKVPYCPLFPQQREVSGNGWRLAYVGRTYDLFVTDDECDPVPYIGEALRMTAEDVIESFPNHVDGRRKPTTQERKEIILLYTSSEIVMQETLTFLRPHLDAGLYERQVLVTVTNVILEEKVVVEMTTRVVRELK